MIRRVADLIRRFLNGIIMKLLYNARIYTHDPARPVAGALAIDRGVVVAVGDARELLDRFSGRAEKEDLQGRVVLPGLTDAHLHFQYYSLGLKKVDCETDTLDECLRRIAARVRVTPPGEWVLGHGWNQNNWPELNGGWPSTAALDAVSPDHPVYLIAKSHHAGWANTAALRLAGISASTPDPEDGSIQRGPNGQPTGILFETAMQLVSRMVPEPQPAELAEAMLAAQENLWQMGLTGFHDFDRRTCFLALQQLRESGKLGLRIVKTIPLDDLAHAVELGLRTGFGDDWLWIGPVKVFMDGALGPRTAAMFQPYLNEPENRGILNFDGEELFETGRTAAESGLSLAVHAIGDRANHETLNAFEQLRSYERASGKPSLRHRIEHVQLLHPDDVHRLGELNVIASMQPIHAPSDMPMADRYWGSRAKYAYAWRSQLEHKAPLAFGSDAPVESPNPFWGLHAAVTRTRPDGSPGLDGWYPEQRLTLTEALQAYTTGAAYAAGRESRLGRLAEGFHADLILLEQDLFELPLQELKNIAPLATMVAGRWVWRR